MNFGDVVNGFCGMQRDIVIRICNLLWSDSNRIKLIFGMCGEIYEWKKHSYFKNNRPADVIVSNYVLNLNEGFKPMGKGLDVQFMSRKSMVFDFVPQGINKLTVSVSNFSGIPFGIGVVAEAEVNMVLNYNPAYTSRFIPGMHAYDLRREVPAVALLAVSQWYPPKVLNFRTGEVVLPKFNMDNNILLSAEYDTKHRTLHFFRDGQLVPGCITHVPDGCFFMITGDRHTSRFVSLQHTHTPSLGVAYPYRCIALEWVWVG